MINKFVKSTGYLYIHIRNDTGEVFYIGVGTDNKNFERARNSRNRNKFWKKIVAKTSYRIEIIFENKPIKWILEKEVEFIALYGRRDLKRGSLTNLTDGGESEIRNSKSKNRESFSSLDHSKYVNYNLFSPDGIQYTGTNISALAREFNVDAHGLRALARGIVRISNGFVASQEDVFRILSPKKELVMFTQIKKFCEKYDLRKTCIQNVLHGNNGHCYGWHLENPNPKHLKSISNYLFNNYTSFSFFNPEGNLVTTNNLTQFAIENDLCIWQLRRVITGVHVFHKGFSNSQKLYEFIDKNGFSIKVNNLIEFQNYYNISSKKTLSDLIMGTYKKVLDGRWIKCNILM